MQHLSKQTQFEGGKYHQGDTQQSGISTKARFEACGAQGSLCSVLTPSPSPRMSYCDNGLLAHMRRSIWHILLHTPKLVL